MLIHPMLMSQEVAWGGGGGGGGEWDDRVRWTNSSLSKAVIQYHVSKKKKSLPICAGSSFVSDELSDAAQHKGYSENPVEAGTA